MIDAIFYYHAGGHWRRICVDDLWKREKEREIHIKPLEKVQSSFYHVERFCALSRWIEWICCFGRLRDCVAPAREWLLRRELQTGRRFRLRDLHLDAMIQLASEDDSVYNPQA